MSSIPLISHRMFVAAVAQEQRRLRRVLRSEPETSLPGRVAAVTLEAAEWGKGAPSEARALTAPAVRQEG